MRLLLNGEHDICDHSVPDDNNTIIAISEYRRPITDMHTLRNITG